VNYSKPKIVDSVPALNTIQGKGKIGNPTDGKPAAKLTVPAYEADE
jgi:hypothetical protein